VTASAFGYTGWALLRLDRATGLARNGDVPNVITYATETMTQLTGDQPG
jgi:hypothetical protein